MKPLFCVNQSIMNKKKIVVYGIGEKAVLTFSVLLQNNIYVDYFCTPDGSNTHLKIMNKAIKTLSEIQKEKENVIIIAGGLEYLNDVEKLEQEGFEVFYDFNLSSYEGNSVLLQGE